MPLTYVVEHLNRQLVELHPDSDLVGSARYIYENGKLSACVGPATLLSDIVDMDLVDSHRHKIRSSRLVVQLNGSPVSADFIYQLAWNARDVVFVDRFVRTLHALNHINEQHERARVHSLVVDVHWRHLCAVPEAHGEVYEQLLATLGLQPDNIILRIDGNALISINKVQKAISNFIQRGYGLCAYTPSLNDKDLALLGSVGVTWISGLENHDAAKLVAIDDLVKKSAAGKNVA